MTKERAIELESNGVLPAWREGKQLEHRHIDGDKPWQLYYGEHPDFYNDHWQWRVAPESKLRPWKVDHRPEIKALAESVEGLTSEQRNYELERLAEEAWKALIIKLPVIDQTGQLGVKVDDKLQHNRDVADSAFALAEAFISEREKRRNQCP